MRHYSWKLLLCGLLLASQARESRAFSMLGPFDTWQVVEIGYFTDVGDDIGGPMNLAEEYRWNLPIITYGFDESFLNYFGAKGVEEIEKAIKVLNDLPPCSQFSANLSEYPRDTRRVNYRASALSLVDLKSYVLGVLLEAVGLAPPDRYVWTLRGRVVINDIPYYTVIQRNFDPVTRQPSSYVNGTLYTYRVLQTYSDPNVWEAVEFEVDPSLPDGVSAVASSMIGDGTVFAAGYYVNNLPGLFYTGLTRDDVGGLRELYRPNNFNVETLLTNTLLAARSSPVGNYLVGASEGSPWAAPPGLVLTNATGTNAIPVLQSLRPGMDKLNFTRVDFDSYVGIWLPLTNVYQDFYLTNSILKKQLVQRSLDRPDILFSAADLGLVEYAPIFFVRNSGWVNQDAINGISGTALAGPGLIQPPLNFTFSKLGQAIINSPEGGQVDGIVDVWWGSYDGTTNAPVVYPIGTSISTIENLVQSGKTDEGPSPWRNPLEP